MYMQGMLGNTKEIRVTSDWQLMDDVIYNHGITDSVAY